ncbi:hypothetical protein FDUTEX481_08604 [Tolypothrix sp. PCC 7601]|nr:hypothetical protein FDUTEX481_08604 [Tolypothrix sp. PCC 7601]
MISRQNSEIANSWSTACNCILWGAIAPKAANHSFNSLFEACIIFT